MIQCHTRIGGVLIVNSILTHFLHFQTKNSILSYYEVLRESKDKVIGNAKSNVGYYFFIEVISSGHSFHLQLTNL